jgi:hypothetical protein
MSGVDAGALLYDGRDMFDKQNAKADEVLRSIVNSLPEAVATCAAAAAAELDPLRQTVLLKVTPFLGSLMSGRYSYPFLLAYDPVPSASSHSLLCVSSCLCVCASFMSVAFSAMSGRFHALSLLSLSPAPVSWASSLSLQAGLLLDCPC